MRKIFVLSLAAIFVFSLVNGVLACPPNNQSNNNDNDQQIENSWGTINNTINISSSTGSNTIKLGGTIVTGDSSSYIRLNNLINTNTLSGNLRGDQSIRNSSGTVNNNLTANSYTGSNVIYLGGTIYTGLSSSGVNVVNIVNQNIVGN